jgi:hypothetical protein
MENGNFRDRTVWAGENARTVPAIPLNGPARGILKCKCRQEVKKTRPKRNDVVIIILPRKWLRVLNIPLKFEF